MNDKRMTPEEIRVRAAYFRIMAAQVRRSIFYSRDKEADARSWEHDAACLEACDG